MHLHEFIESNQPGYEVCKLCGTFHSTGLQPRDELYLNNYWNGTTRSLLKDQVTNLTETESCGVSKVDKVLQYITEPGDVLEVACAPGELMRRLIHNGHYVVGIEPDKENIPGIKAVCGATPLIIEGYFPECLDRKEIVYPFKYIIALDVVEHVADYHSFFKAVKKYLLPGGTFIFMSPIILRDGFFRQRDMIPEEHAHIFTEAFLLEYLGEMFKEVTLKRWQVGHEVCICKA